MGLMAHGVGREKETSLFFGWNQTRKGVHKKVGYLWKNTLAKH